jgi:hypothetical protein
MERCVSLPKQASVLALRVLRALRGKKRFFGLKKLYGRAVIANSKRPD